MERWLESDDPAPPYIDYSSDAALQFLSPIVEKRTPHSHTRLGITAASLDDGWLQLAQCHSELDPVPAAEVVYRFRSMRKLQVVLSENIASASVDGQSVQLVEVGHAARLCVSAEVQILGAAPGGVYTLRYGPFQRRFLDSYFPLHVTLDIHYPPQLLQLTEIKPDHEGNYHLLQGDGYLSADAWFSGELSFEVGFKGGSGSGE